MECLLAPVIYKKEHQFEKRSRKEADLAIQNRTTHSCWASCRLPRRTLQFTRRRTFFEIKVETNHNLANERYSPLLDDVSACESVFESALQWDASLASTRVGELKLVLC